MPLDELRVLAIVDTRRTALRFVTSTSASGRAWWRPGTAPAGESKAALANAFAPGRYAPSVVGALYVLQAA